MNLIITNQYRAYTDTQLLGYQGETNARTIKVAQPHIDEATAYRLIFDCGNDVIYEVDVTDGEYIVDSGLLINVGTVKCQWQAVKLVGDTYELVAKSNIIEFEVKPSIQGDVAPIPTYEQSKSALDEVLQAAEQAQDAEAAAEVAEQAKTETITAAETAIQKAAEAEQSAISAAESLTAAGQSKTAAETAASNASQSSETATAKAGEATQAATQAAESAQTAADKAAEIAASAEQIATNTDDIAVLKSTFDIGQKGNLIDPEECVVGRIITSSDTTDGNANYVSTGKIPTLKDKHYTFGNNAGVRDVTYITEYDNNGKFIKASESGHYYGYDSAVNGFIRIVKYSELGTFKTAFMCYECAEAEFEALTGNKYNRYDGTFFCEPKLKTIVDENTDRIESIEKKITVTSEICVNKNDMYQTSETLLAPSISDSNTLSNVVNFGDELFSWNDNICEYTDRLTQKTPVKLGYTVTFGFKGTELEIAALSKNTRFYIVVDNVIVTDKIYYDATNTKYYAKFSLHAGDKIIQIIAYGTLFGVAVNNISDLYKIDVDKPLCVFDGDSITESTAILASGTGAVYGYPHRIGQKFDWEILNCAVGGSGYVKTGNQGQPNMVDRFSEYIVPYSPEIFIACGGLNDMEQEMEAVANAIDTYWRNAVEMLDTSNIIVCSPFSPFTAESETLNLIACYCKDTALKYHLPYIDLINGITYDAMGSIISQNANGIITENNKPEYIGDGTHLTVKGHEYMANRVSMEIWKILYHKYGLLY